MVQLAVLKEIKNVVAQAQLVAAVIQEIFVVVMKRKNGVVKVILSADLKKEIALEKENVMTKRRVVIKTLMKLAVVMKRILTVLAAKLQRIVVLLKQINGVVKMGKNVDLL